MDTDPDDEGGFWDRPLWRIWLPMMILPFIVGQVVLAYMEIRVGGSWLDATLFLLVGVAATVAMVAVFQAWGPIPDE